MILFMCYIFLIVTVNTAWTQKIEGDSCQTSSGVQGICRQLKKCVGANNVRNQESSVPTCLSSSKYEIKDGKAAKTLDPVICCPKIDRSITSVHTEKCVDYGKKVFQMTVAPIPTIEPVYVNVSLCGHTAQPLIVGGENAEGREFPHMALLGFGQENNIQWECGGSLISEDFVLTAAHCLYNRKRQLVDFVRIGDLDIGRTNDDAQPQQFNVIERYIHPRHNSTTGYYDVALLKLNKKIKVTAYVRPACLYDKRAIPNKFLATGWGNLHDIDEEKTDHLQKVVLQHTLDEECRNKYAERNIQSNIQFCAISDNDEIKDTCQGDSGGPLQIYHPTVYCMYSIVGVTSFGKPCGTSIYPGVYSNVPAMLPWIEEIVWGT